MAKSEIKPIRKDIPLSEIERRIKALRRAGESSRGYSSYGTGTRETR
jgi:hypothetical protein